MSQELPPSPSPRFTVVIPVYDKLEYTQPCLASLARTLPASVASLVVVDNGSTDGTAEWLATQPQVRTIRNPENRGFANACNLGARAATTPYVLFLNNDVVAHDGWWEPLVALLDADPRVVATGSRLLFPDGTLQHAGVMLIDDEQLPDPLVARHVHHGAPGDLPDAQQRRCYQALTAACLMVRREAFEAVGGFDEGYWNGYEDIDLCLKLQAHGLLVYEPTSVLTHHESKSGPQRFAKAMQNVERLHDRWLGHVAVDGVIEPDGRFRWTEAARIRDLAGSPVRDTLPAGRVPGRVSLVILTWNQLDVTRACIDSLRRHTAPEHEWVFVDNGSTDGTVGFLRTLAAERANTVLIENADNLGFARGCNQGREVATGEYVLFLNNDVVVTEGWLDGLRECLMATPRAGFVGPMTNAISGRQQVDAVGYDTLEGLEAYAADWRARHRHQRVTSARVVGFCMLGRAALLDRIGGFDESFGTGNFEDDDLCLRAELAGFRNVIAGDVFIHHFGSRSFLGNGLDHAATMTHNRGVFDAKWNRSGAGGANDHRVVLLEALERAATLEATGRLRDAVELYLEAVRLAPTETESYRALAAMLLRAGHAKDALEVLQNLPAGLTDAGSRLVAARAHLVEGDTDTARHLLDSLLDEPEVNARAMNLRGLLAHTQGDAETATASFNAAIAADRGYGEPYAHLGALLWQRDPGEQALDLLERGFMLSPDSPEALEYYTAAAKAIGDPARAATVLRETNGLHPVNRALMFAWIDVLLAGGQDAEAMHVIENALEWFEVDDGLLAAALAVRERVGAYTIGDDTDARGTISVCMIVKNEEAHIVRAIRSVSPVASEVIVVDTGSTDRTRALATALGARVVTQDWTGDFSAARNRSLQEAAGDWILVLDADEVVAPSDLPNLLRAVQQAGPVAGYVLTTRNHSNDPNTAGFTAHDGRYPGQQAGAGWFPSHKVRLFRNDPRVRFEGALHEVVDDALARHRLPVRPLDVPVHHDGPLVAAREAVKAVAYHDLARRKLEENPDDLQALRECAVQSGVVGDHEDAIELWWQVVRHPQATDRASDWMNLGRAYLENHAYDASARASREALVIDPNSRAALYNLALAELCRGRDAEAIGHCERLVQADDRDTAAWMLLAAASALTDDTRRWARTQAVLALRDEPLAAALQMHAARLREAGRGDEVRRLDEAARAAWRTTLVTLGMDDDEATLDEVMRQSAKAA